MPKYAAYDQLNQMLKYINILYTSRLHKKNTIWSNLLAIYMAKNKLYKGEKIL